jgi:hypothetical protein
MIISLLFFILQGYENWSKLVVFLAPKVKTVLALKELNVFNIQVLH